MLASSVHGKTQSSLVKQALTAGVEYAPRTNSKLVQFCLRSESIAPIQPHATLFEIRKSNAEGKRTELFSEKSRKKRDYLK
jgi:hypothetical protein